MYYVMQEGRRWRDGVRTSFSVATRVHWESGTGANGISETSFQLSLSKREEAMISEDRNEGD